MKRMISTCVAVMGCTAVLSGCVEFADPSATPSTDSQIIEFVMSEAIADGIASERQIEILESAVTAGTVTRADVDLASADFLTCLDDAGLEYYYNEEEAVAGSGVWIPAPLILASDDGSDREADILSECQFRHAIYVASAYAAQTWVAQAEDRVWSSEAVRACLSARGFPIADNATPDEIKVFNEQDLLDHVDDPGFTPCVGNGRTWSPEDME